MSGVWQCCSCCHLVRRRESSVRYYTETLHSPDVTSRRQSTPDDERKHRDNLPDSASEDIDPKALNIVKKKLKNVLPSDTTHEHSCSLAKRYLSPINMEYYFSHLVSGMASDVIIETTDELESSFNNTWEKAMLQKRSLQRFEAVVNFPVKLILSDLKMDLPPFVSTFSKMIQLEFGPLHAALIIDNIILEWDDTSLIMPSTAEKEWVFQTRLEGRYDKITQDMKPEMKDSARKMDLKRQIEQVFEVTKEKQKAINHLIEVIIHYNESYEYNVLTRNCQHFVIDAMKALGIDEVPQFTGIFQNYLKELKKGKSTDILEKFDSHAALDEHVNAIIKPGLSQHDLEYLLCQYFMFHVSSRKESPNAQDPNWRCEEETCRMSDIEYMLERDAGSLLFTTFSLNAS